VAWDPSTFIADANRASVPRLLIQTQHALALSQESLGEVMGVSRRTVWRWQSGQAFPIAVHLHALARKTYAVDRDLAARLADARNATLESLGLVAPAKTSTRVPSTDDALRTRLLVDAIVCAAAEALDASPGAVRRALHAAFVRARQTGLALDAIEQGLAPANPRAKPARRTREAAPKASAPPAAGPRRARGR
jgi:transcriptional regulator with XRE-family HTH domain